MTVFKKSPTSDYTHHHSRDVNKTLSHKTETRPRRSIFSNSQDQEGTETFNLQDRDETRRSRKRLETTSRPRRKTETFQKRIKTAVSQLKNANW